VERREAQRPGGEPRKLVTAGRARLGMGLANPSARRVRVRRRNGRAKGAVVQRPGASRRSMSLREEEENGKGVPAPWQLGGGALADGQTQT
jgi:hypothetical protein